MSHLPVLRPKQEGGPCCHKSCSISQVFLVSPLPQPVKMGWSSKRETSTCSPSPEMIAALQAPRKAGLCKNVTKPKAMSHSLRSKGCLCPFSFAKLSVTGYKWSVDLIPLLLSTHWMPCSVPVLFFFFLTCEKVEPAVVLHTCFWYLSGWEELVDTCLKNEIFLLCILERKETIPSSALGEFTFLFFSFPISWKKTVALSCAWEVRNKASGNLCCWHSVTEQWGMLYHLNHASSLEELWKI